METFGKFEIKNQEVIFGGALYQTTWTDGVVSGKDAYDSETKRLMYFS